MGPSGGPVAPAGPEFPPVGVEWRLCGDRWGAHLFSLLQVWSSEALLMPQSWKPCRLVPRGTSPHPIPISCLERPWQHPCLTLPLPSSCGDTYKPLSPLSGSCPWGTAQTSRLCVCSHATLRSFINQGFYPAPAGGSAGKKHPFVPFL